MTLSPCLACGACCAAFCVKFPESEADDFSGGCVPAALTDPVPGARRAMKGTWSTSPRCHALEGRVGTRVNCAIYKDRPSVCRDFAISWKQGKGNTLCDRARAMFGLQPFSQW